VCKVAICRQAEKTSTLMEQPYIRIRGLSHHFGKNEVLRDLDLDILRSETLVILGTSGAGKSVLLKHLAGLLRPTHGSIQIDGLDIANLDERSLGPVRRNMGVLFQGGALFDSLTVAENVAFPLRESAFAFINICVTSSCVGNTCFAKLTMFNLR